RARRAGRAEGRARSERHPQPRQARAAEPLRPESRLAVILVIDVGTSSVRAGVVDVDAQVVVEHKTPLLPDSPAAGLVEFDAAVMAEAVLDLARRAVAEVGSVRAVGIANQRASTIVWDRATGEPVAPAQGWQDLRVVGRFLELQAAGHRFP